jgi:enduracididine beta-hydroxylase
VKKGEGSPTRGRAGRIDEFLDDVSARFSSAEAPAFLAEVTVLAHELPRRLRLALNEFRLCEPASGICRVLGYRLKDDSIGPTPAHWKQRQTGCVPVRQEFLLVLLGSLLGDVISWATQQDGAIVHDIAPIQGHEHEQLGSGSAEELTWHTEDAFHPCRGDYLGMMCLRNPDRVPTTFAPVDVSTLDKGTLDLLFKPLYTIRPDNSYLRKHRMALTGDGESLVEAAHNRIDAMSERPEKIAVLFGSPSAPRPGQTVAVVDPGTLRPVAPGTVGEIWLSGPSVAAGYWRRPEETADVPEGPDHPARA